MTETSPLLEPPNAEEAIIADHLQQHFWCMDNDKVCACGWKFSRFDSEEWQDAFNNAEEEDDPAVRAVVLEYTTHVARELLVKIGRIDLNLGHGPGIRPGVARLPRADS